ncbi:MAG TPA: hypothetical protein VN947_30820 [Polyangia bacterium]|nr:hypothetical protein [Polyangia bacterium]
MGLGALPLVITLVVAPAQLKMEADAAPATVTVTVTSPGAPHLRLWCSAGTLSPAPPRQGGRFTVRYTPPAAGKPTYAVLAAWDEASGEAATATVTLIGRTEIPVETEGGALVTAVVRGHRSTAHANPTGHARVPAWVWPGDRTATVIATDAAGNATSSEVALDLPPPDGVFLLAPQSLTTEEPVRVWAFAPAGVTPELAATGASLSSVERRPGATAAMLEPHGEVTLTATAGGDRATQRIGFTHRRLDDYELGLALVGRYSGSFGGVGPTLELRRRFNRWFALGADLVGRYDVGRIGPDEARGGGLGGSAIAEGRFAVARRLTLFADLGVGFHWTRFRRANPAQKTVTTDYGGFVVSLDVGVLFRVGPGWLTAALGYSYAGLLPGASQNLDGGILSVGYRLGRSPRRRRRRGGGGTRSRRRRRRAPGT